MKKSSSIFIIIFIMCSSGIYAQVTQEWVATYNGTGAGSFSASKNATDKSGNVIVAGRAEIFSTDYLVLKYNPSGNLLWSRTYDGNSNSTDWLRDMILDDSGNVYVTGNSRETDGAYNWVTIKYNTDGVLMWKKSLDWTLNKEDVPFSITLDKDRNILVAGYGWALPEGFQNFDVITAKYNNDGKELWIRSYNSQAFHADWGYSVVTDDSCNAYVSGYAYFRNIVTIKYDKDGNQVWIKEYPRMSSEYAIPLFSKIDNQSNVIVNGYYQVGAQSNFVTVKYDRNGNLLWDRIFDNPVGNLDIANELIIDDSSNILIAGRTFTIFFNDVLILKYSSKGDTLLTKTFDNGYLGEDQAFSLITDKLGNIYATGSSYSMNGNDFLTLKFSTSGELVWTRFYNYPLSFPNSDLSYSISLDYNSNVIISGVSYYSLNQQAVISIKYSQLSGLDENNFNLSNYYNFYNYPNPFNPETNIFYSVKNAGTIRIEIFDVQGKRIKVLIDENKLTGNYKIKFDGSNLLSGIYFCTLELNSIRLKTIKLLLLK